MYWGSLEDYCSSKISECRKGSKASGRNFQWKIPFASYFDSYFLLLRQIEHCSAIVIANFTIWVVEVTSMS